MTNDERHKAVFSSSLREWIVRDLWEEGSFIMGFKTAEEARAEARRLNEAIGHGPPRLTIVGKDYAPEAIEDDDIPF